MGEWLRDNLDALGFAVTLIGLLLAIVLLFVRITGKHPVTPRNLLAIVAGIAIAVLGLVLLLYPPPDPPSTSPGPTSPAGSPGGALGPTTSPIGPSFSDPPTDASCNWQDEPVEWDNSGLGLDALPASGHDLTVAIGACETVLLDGTRFRLEDGTACEGHGIALCVVVWQSPSSYSTVVTNLDEAANFVGHTQSSYQYALDDKLPLWWKVPNCTSGCAGAYITVYVGGRRIQANILVEPRP